MFAVCQVEGHKDIPGWASSRVFCSVTRTPDELSIVCPQDLVPKEVKAVRGWRSLRVEGELDFTLVGILSSLTSTLSENGISTFAISTYNTDYLLLKESDLDRGVAALREAGHTVTI